MTELHAKVGRTCDSEVKETEYFKADFLRQVVKNLYASRGWQESILDMQILLYGDPYAYITEIHIYILILKHCIIVLIYYSIIVLIAKLRLSPN